MKNLISLFTLLFVLQQNGVAAPANIPENVPTEAWLSLTCNGVVTPPTVYPPVFVDVMTFYVKVDPNKPRPSLKELSRNASYMPKFDQITRLCTEKRTQIEKNYVAPAQWMDWGMDYGYSRFTQGEVFIPMSNTCRGVGQPCERISQCCGYSAPVMSRTTCNLDTNMCVKTMQTTSVDNSAGTIKNRN